MKFFGDLAGIFALITLTLQVSQLFGKSISLELTTLVFSMLTAFSYCAQKWSKTEHPIPYFPEVAMWIWAFVSLTQYLSLMLSAWM